MVVKTDDHTHVAEDTSDDAGSWGSGGGYLITRDRGPGGGFIDFSVGTTSGVFNPTVEPGERVPPLGEWIIGEAEERVLGETARYKTTQNREILHPPGSPGRMYRLVVGSTTYEGTLEDLGHDPRAVLIDNNSVQQTIVASSDEDEDMSILGDIYTTVDAGLGGVLPGGVPLQVPSGWGGPAVVYAQDPTINLPVPQVQGAMGPPGPPPINASSCSADDPYKGWVWKRVCGQWKWVKKKYRRRKQLFTSRDASQLSSLLGIAGKSEIAKTWIASHPS